VERGNVKEKEKGRVVTRSRATRSRQARRRLRLVWAIVIVFAAVYLYYRPLSSYVETRRDLAASRADVEALRQAKSSLQLRLVNSTSTSATEREARRLGYVKPNEQLFLVKGLSAWRKAHAEARGAKSP
jgi:cell division protein FtsB